MTTLGFDATPLLGQRSGVGHYTSRLLSAVIALTPDWNHQLYSNKPLEDLEPPLVAAEQVEGYMPTSRWLWMQLKLPQVIEREQPDLFHFTNSLAPLSQSRPFVLTVHDASLFLYRQYHPWKRIAAMRFLLPHVARRAAAVITPSETARRDVLATLHLPPNRVHVVYEAPPDTFRRVTDPATLHALQSKYGLPDKFILFVGTLEPRKNLERLVTALRRAHDDGCHMPLFLAGPVGWHMGDGDGNGHGGSHFSGLIHQLGLQDWVHYLGYVPTEDLPGLYSLATVFAFPSLYEGFGLPVVEAMICGAPVLTSRNSAMSEICGDAAELVDPLDVDSIATGLLHLCRDASRRDELRELGFTRASRYSWTQAAAETLAIYTHVLSGAAV